MSFIPSKLTERPEIMSFRYVFSTYISFLIFFFFGYYQNTVSIIHKAITSRKRPPIAPITSGFERFYHDRIYARVTDCFNNTIRSAPSTWIRVAHRVSDPLKQHWRVTEGSTACLNFGSYNYLGFAAKDTNAANERRVLASMSQLGISMGQPVRSSMHDDLAKAVATFMRKPAAMVCAMGFATNSTSIPALVGPDGLIISDSLNHASIVVGGRASVGHKKVFRHDDMAHLEKTVRNAILNGMPRTHNHWSKIVIIVEGIYSMEGTICNLPEIVRIAKQYGCYLYVDEAHSIGALGRHGGGVCDYFDDKASLLRHARALLEIHPAYKVWSEPELWADSLFDPDFHDLDILKADHERYGMTLKTLDETMGPFSFFNAVDILMGTFTKSFSAVGGYIAADHATIDYLHRNSHGAMASEPLSPACIQQIMGVLTSLLEHDDIATRQIRQLARNTRWFRTELVSRGFHIMGSDDSPVVPVLLYHPQKLLAFHRLCFEAGIAVVVVAYPACSLVAGRVRFCLSGGHTDEDMRWAMRRLDEIGDILKMKYGK
ncbi:Serine-C-palmitoyltransferase long chain base biosynthesis protein 1 [Carpediemonas membranifera]|uniref:serine C-palmitoyltransferase n=1 Tax=Carpediemonas membranifera TaxID=201153 RepID=A0A8J6C0L7_9EUKA|nr:Serine-C-palmitoyltransferase long chain base biosynthesis protein 1 [Carpediemonas membranifera]|eukprot:KAG9396711.1 Serine-C-palmitoyltransferase long chain base biosynthesis protein 1 [Carpediemonas membranifera]